MEKINIEVIRSRRKNLSLEVKKDGRVIVRAPLRTSESYIKQFVEKNKDWLYKAIAKSQLAREERENTQKLSKDEIDRLKGLAKEIIPKKVEYYARLIGVTYNDVTIKCQKTRWGSCSAKGNLNFNCLLMLAPDEVVDSVVVHELCHRLHMDHSRAFYYEVKKVFPNYDRCRKWLNENGKRLLYSVE